MAQIARTPAGPNRAVVTKTVYVHPPAANLSTGSGQVWRRGKRSR